MFLSKTWLALHSVTCKLFQTLNNFVSEFITLTPGGPSSPFSPLSPSKPGEPRSPWNKMPAHFFIANFSHIFFLSLQLLFSALFIVYVLDGLSCFNMFCTETHFSGMSNRKKVSGISLAVLWNPYSHEVLGFEAHCPVERNSVVKSVWN